MNAPKPRRATRVTVFGVCVLGMTAIMAMLFVPRQREQPADLPDQPRPMILAPEGESAEPSDEAFRATLRRSLVNALEATPETAADDAKDILNWVDLALADDPGRALLTARSKSLSWFFECSPREAREFETAFRRMKRSELELLERPPEPYQEMGLSEWAAFVESAPLSQLYLVRGPTEAPIRRVFVEHTRSIRVPAGIPSDDRWAQLSNAFESTLDLLAAAHGPPPRFSMGPPLFLPCDDGGAGSPLFEMAEAVGVIAVCESVDGRLSALLTVFVRHPRAGWIPANIITRTWPLHPDAPDAPWRPRI